MMGVDSADQIISLTAGMMRWLFTWSCQAFLLLGLAWVGLKLDRSRSATTRYRIWLIALVAVAALPLLSLLTFHWKATCLNPPEQAWMLMAS